VINIFKTSNFICLENVLCICPGEQEVTEAHSHQLLQLIFFIYF